MEIKPEIVDGVAFYNVDPKNKRAFSDLFEQKLRELFRLETEAKGSRLTTQEVSRLRRHPDLGVWVIDGKPASVTDLNAFLSGKKKNLSLNVPQKQNQFFNRKWLESPKNMPREVRRWFKRLDNNGWPEGMSRKGFTNYLSRSYDQTLEYNKILENKLGFKFDAGHFWGAMGPKGDRTIIGPYGPRSEGKFTFRNVTSQPTLPSMKQLLNPTWNVITPNVPGFFDKRSVQVTGAEELLNVGGGGQGWSGALADYLTQGLNDIDKMDAWDKAYIAFGDPNKGAGATAEVRLAELLEPGGKDRVLARVSEFAETAEDLSGGVKTANLFDQPFDSPHLLRNLSRDVIDQLNTIKNMPIKERRLAVKALAGSGALTLFGGFGTGMSAAETLGRKNIYEETGDPLDKLQYQISGASLGFDVGSYIPTPITAVGGSVGSLLADAVNTGIDFWRNPLTEKERNKAFLFATDLQQGNELTSSPSDPSFIRTNKPELTAPGTVEVEEKDEETGETVIKRYPTLRLPKV